MPSPGDWFPVLENLRKLLEAAPTWLRAVAVLLLLFRIYLPRGSKELLAWWRLVLGHFFPRRGRRRRDR